jgi:hypothetical protein
MHFLMSPMIALQTLRDMERRSRSRVVPGSHESRVFWHSQNTEASESGVSHLWEETDSSSPDAGRT